MAAPMDQETMEAKLQLVMNVVHLTCLNAAVTDFKSLAGQWAGHITTLSRLKLTWAERAGQISTPCTGGATTHLRWWLPRENTGLCLTGPLLLSWWRRLRKGLRSPRNHYVPHGMTLRQRVSASGSVVILGRPVTGPTTALIVRSKATLKLITRRGSARES